MEHEEESKWKLLPGILIILTTIIPATIGVMFFHSDNQVQQPPPDELDYTSPPPVPEFSPPTEPPPMKNTTPPENPPPPQNFTYNMSSVANFIAIDTTNAPQVGWRFKGFDRYASTGFTVSKDASSELSSFRENSGTSEYVQVLALNLSSGETNPLVYLQKPGEERPLAENFQIETPEVESAPQMYISDITDDLGANVDTEQQVFNLSYHVFLNYIDRNIAKTSSASIADTKSALTSELQEYFLQLPGGRSNYLAEHPAVNRLANEAEVDESASVYEQVQALGNIFTLEYTVNNATAPEGSDMVSWFVNNKGGTPIHFSTSLALLMRVYGIPSRMVVGYLGGSINQEEGITVLSQQSMGTWVEVYDASLGWTPYSAWLHFMGLRYRNIVNCGLAVGMTANAPHETDGVKWAYSNETFSLSVTITGDGLSPLLGHNVTFYDTNESTPLGNVPFTWLVEGESLIATLRTSFQAYIDDLSNDDYGLHIFRAQLKARNLFAAIALVRRTTIE